MDSPGREPRILRLATNGPLALAPDLASRLERPIGVSPGSGVTPEGGAYAIAPPSQTMTEPVLKLEMSDAR
jgi:hypothetical protein